MATPYSALKLAVKALDKAYVSLNDAVFLADVRNATLQDIRSLMWGRDQTQDIIRVLAVPLECLRRLHAPPANEDEALRQQKEPAEVTPLGPQEPPDDPMIYNRRQADGTFRSLAGFWERDETPPADEEA